MRITSVYLEHLQDYTATKGPTSLAQSLPNYVPFWESRNQKLLHIAPRVMGKWKMHQTLIRMIGKLPEQKKINWPAHLPEVIQAYNGTKSAITGYSPHYLTFSQRPRFPIDLYFLTLRGESEKFRVNHYVADIQKCLEQALEVA